MGYALGIDTSNYKTSIALVDKDNNIFYDDRRFLRVVEGEKGLRQQEAFYQHVNRLPNMLKYLFSTLDEIDGKIDVIAVSDKPRDVDGSYMPCFNAGVAFAETLALALKCPLYKFSHQEGHIAAGKRFTPLGGKNEFVAFHFSGGTTEALMVKDNKVIEIIGGTKDISFGQLIDRIGVKLGLPFPAGEEIDYGAIRWSSGKIIYSTDKAEIDNTTNEASRKYKYVPRIKVDDSFVNLSGIETGTIRNIESLAIDNIGDDQIDEISFELMNEIAYAIDSMMDKINQKTQMKDFLFVGGVSSSSYIRDYIEKSGKKKDYQIAFASPELTSDNAIGIAFLGGDSIWL